MIHQIFKSDTGFVWLDVVAPTQKELTEIAKTHGLHPSSVRDCLDPEHLPKFERIGDMNFLILRAYDESSPKDADTIQELTRKTAIFYNDKILISIHRKDQPVHIKLREKWKNPEEQTQAGPVIARLFSDLVGGIIETYEPPIDEALDELEQVEMGVFEATGSRPFELQQGYFLKRKSFVFKRMIRIISDLLPKMTSAIALDPQQTQDLKDQLDTSYFYTDELTESITNLLSLHISLASQKTNEVVRILTIFSVFLLPLNVITGIYGMNFEHMPELKWHFGYPLALFTMVMVLTTIYLWFRQRGWLK